MYKPIKPLRVSDEIVNQIKGLISQGRLKPGDRLPPERELVELLGVSRPSLREAPNSLTTMGFLEVKQAKRTFVKSMTSPMIQDPLSLLIKADTQRIFDLIEVRKALEAWTAFHAAERATEEDIRQLEAILQKMKGAMKKGESWEKLDADFHLALAQATHNTIQIHIMSNIYDLLKESTAKIFTDPKKLQKLLEQHGSICSAVRGHAPDKAREQTMEHLNYVESEVRGSTSQTGEARAKRD
jgi:GntR family transcriptional repressor for pyruvate dehydrogenase complex